MQNFIVIVFVGNIKSELIIMFYLHYEKYSIKGNEKTNIQIRIPSINGINIAFMGQSSRCGGA